MLELTVPQIKQQLRQNAKQKRNLITAEEQEKASLQILEILKTQDFFLNSQNLAFYLPKDREIDPKPLIAFAASLGKKCFLPVLDPSHPRELLFAAYLPNDPLTPNRFDVLEPEWQAQTLIARAKLDLVFLPLLAFDKKGQRLGRGGGYYDHSFATVMGPKLIGLAYDFQELDRIPEEPWDVKLQGVVTNTKFISFYWER